jgi:hypothetical protein
VRVDARPVEQLERRLPVGARDVEQAAGGLVPGPDAVEVERAAVAQQHQVGAAGRVVRHVELVALRVAAEVGQRVEDQDPRIGAEAVAVELRRRQAARARADDHAVVVVLALERPARRVDAGAAPGAVHVARVRGAVDAHRVAHHRVVVATQAGDRRRVVTRRQRPGLAAERRGQLRLRARQVRRSRGRGESRRGDRHSVQEIPSGDPVLPALRHARSSPGVQ